MSELDEMAGLLAEYALGTLSDEERARVEAALSQSPALAAQLQDLEASMTVVTMSLRPPEEPWKKVCGTLEGGKRFAHLVPALASHFDIPEERAVELVNAFDEPARWGEGPAPGLSLMPVEAGPRWAGFLTVVVRLEPGAQLPMHTHAAREQVLVLEGGYRDDQSGREFWRGEVDVREQGTSHSFTAVEGPACICASVVKLAEDA
ncbi:MAG: cupin domain-containing protein [Myxococcaceae bacterium]|nr:cupin domain-containing protein [Myxococcaceae bacterium]